MYYLLSITLISSSEKPSKLLSQRYFFVSETITPLNPNNAIQLGHAIKPFNMSAISHTESRAVTQPINTTFTLISPFNIIKIFFHINTCFQVFLYSPQYRSRSIRTLIRIIFIQQDTAVIHHLGGTDCRSYFF